MRCAECSRRWHELGPKRFGVDAAKWLATPSQSVRAGGGMTLTASAVPVRIDAVY
jgi:hypothetical protein